MTGETDLGCFGVKEWVNREDKVTSVLSAAAMTANETAKSKYIPLWCWFPAWKELHFDARLYGVSEGDRRDFCFDLLTQSMFS